MDKKELKKILAGLSIAGLITAATPAMSGCETAVQGSWSGSKSGAGSITTQEPQPKGDTGSSSTTTEETQPKTDTGGTTTQETQPKSGWSGSK